MRRQYLSDRARTIQYCLPPCLLVLTTAFKGLFVLFRRVGQKKYVFSCFLYGVYRHQVSPPLSQPKALNDCPECKIVLAFAPELGGMPCRPGMSSPRHISLTAVSSEEQLALGIHGDAGFLPSPCRSRRERLVLAADSSMFSSCCLFWS